MNKKIVLTSMAFALMVPMSVTFAEENQIEVTNIQEAQGEQAKKAWEANREQNKQNFEAQREGNKQAFEAQREANKQVMENQREQNKQEFKATQQAKRLEFQDSKERMAGEKCKNIETKIATRVGRYENNAQMLKKVYGNMQARLERLLARLNSAGADTTKLTADIQTLNAMVTKLYTDHTAFMATLKDSQAFVCGKSEGEFKGKMDQARKVPELIKQDREDIKNFFQTTIKTDLQTIRQTLAEQKEAIVKVEAPETTVAPAPKL